MWQQAVKIASNLSLKLNQQPVLVGALALRAHGYIRETDDVDLAVLTSEHDIESAASALGLRLHAKHHFGGYDFRLETGERIDVITLENELPDVVREARSEAIASNRVTNLLGTSFYVASIGHVITLKMIAARKKDSADIIELIKVLVETGRWDRERKNIFNVVRQHLGWYASERDLMRLVEDAERERSR